MEQTAPSWLGRSFTRRRLFCSLSCPMREARASGRLAYATTGPSGLGEAARPGQPAPSSCTQADIAQAAARAADEMQEVAAWAQPGSGAQIPSMPSGNAAARLDDERAARDNGAELPPNIIVRSPTLLETTSVFRTCDRYQCPSPTFPMAEQVCDGSTITPTLATGTRAWKAHLAAVGDPLEDAVCASSVFRRLATGAC